MAQSKYTDETTGLTPREQTVVCYIAIGKTNHEIAELIGTSVKTFDSHRMNASAKLKLRNNVEMTLLALRLGWTTIEGEICHPMYRGGQFVFPKERGL